MNSYALSGISTSLDSDMDHALMSYISHTIVRLMVKGLAVLFQCTMQMLGICSCGVLLSYMWYTKQILFCPYSCSVLIEMLDSSGIP